MAHLLTDEEILAAMELGSEDMRLDEAEAAIKPAVYDRAYRDLMAVNGHLGIPFGADGNQGAARETLSMVNHSGSLKDGLRR